MIQLKNITNSSNQSMVLSGENGEQITFQLIYQPTQQLWYFNLSYLDFDAKGINLVVSPNILYKFKHLLPFGIAVISKDGQDPFYIDDFLTERVIIYLLDTVDLAALNPLFEGTYET